MSFDRVLPKPHLLERHQGYLPKISSNLLDHKIMKDDGPQSAVEKHRDGASGRYAAEADDGAPSSLGRSKVGSLQTKDLPIRDSSAWSHDTKSASKEGARFCICQPDPKIPRPRNGKLSFRGDSIETDSPAFILYRQHYQAAVVAQNPGVPNPDISKIIGEQWRGLSEEVKDGWRALADVSQLFHRRAPVLTIAGRKGSPSAAVSRLPLHASSLWTRWRLAEQWRRARPESSWITVRSLRWAGHGTPGVPRDAIHTERDSSRELEISSRQRCLGSELRVPSERVGACAESDQGRKRSRCTTPSAASRGRKRGSVSRCQTSSLQFPRGRQIRSSF